VAGGTRPGAPGRAGGFSLLELVIVIVLISVLLVVAIDRLLAMKAMAERGAVEQVVGTIRSAIGIRLAELAVRNKLSQASSLAGTNPMLVLGERPQNYLGELFAPNPAALPPGNWYFDTRDGVLCYLVESAEHFETELPGPARACFKIQPVFDDVNRNGRYDEGTEVLRGFRLAALAPYSWNLRFMPLPKRAAQQ
jgi:prepilin-type N-terminal cleavage/methylation domain-containing protein